MPPTHRVLLVVVVVVFVFCFVLFCFVLFLQLLLREGPGHVYLECQSLKLAQLSLTSPSHVNSATEGQPVGSFINSISTM